MTKHVAGCPALKRRNKKPYKTDLHMIILNHIVRELETEKANNGGKLHYRAISKTVDKWKPELPFLTKDIVKYHLRKLSTRNNVVLAVETNKSIIFMNGEPLADASISTLSMAGASAGMLQTTEALASTANKEANTQGQGGKISAGSRGIQQGDNNGVVVPTCEDEGVAGAPANDTNHQGDDDDVPLTLPVFGRPKGTTQVQSRDMKDCLKMATTWAAIEYVRVREHAKETSTRAKPGALTSIIATAKANFGVPEDAKISSFTVRSRAKRLRTNPLEPQGTVTPMLAVEPFIVDIIAQLSRMRQPINVTTGLQLANSIIAGTPFQLELEAWKVQHNVHARRTNSDNPARQQLGWGYWRGFMRRNGHIIRSKKAVKFECKRAEWCTYENFLTMYQEVYEEMVTGGIAVKLDDKVWLSMNGETVDKDDTSAFGLPTSYKIIRPDKMLFVDEVGSNTSQTKDGNVGGEKFLCEAMQRPQMRAATKDSHFTVLGFTAATGVPLMCAIIFAAKEMEESWVLGFDPSAEWIGHSDDIEANAGRWNRHVCTMVLLFQHSAAAPRMAVSQLTFLWTCSA